MQPPAQPSRLPLMLALAVLFLGLLFVATRISGIKDHVTYPLDDTYIHMAIARNVAQSGTWGINAGEFAPASSSPLWTVILAGGFKIFGVQAWIPFAAALLCALALLLMIDNFGRKEGWPTAVRAGVLVTLTIAMPLVPMTVAGMEHILHTLFTLWVIYLIWRLPAAQEALPWTFSAALLLASFLTTAARFEGLFLAMATALVLILQRRWLLALGVVAASAAPVALFGAFSVSHGWSWLPSSVRLKGNFQQGAGLAKAVKGLWAHFSYNFFHWKRVDMISALLCPMVACLLVPATARARNATRVTGVFVLVTLQHLTFAGTGWFFRYEAYLIAADIFVIGLIAGPWLAARAGASTTTFKTREALVLAAGALCLGGPQIARGFLAVWRTPLCMKNIHDQQGQMSDFARRYYPGAVIAANDVGFLSYSGEASQVVDVFGLGDLRIFQAKVKGEPSAAVIPQECAARNAEIAIVYDSVIDTAGRPPQGWRLAGRLEIERNHVCAFSTVSFYATTPAAAGKLAESLKDFAGRVPRDVHISVF